MTKPELAALEDRLRHPSRPAFYALAAQHISDIGREHGYAIAIHGSLRKDLDLIAVPWTEEASAPADLVEAVILWTGMIEAHRPAVVGPTEKPHGRLVWSIPLEGGAFIDFGVMPQRGLTWQALEEIAQEAGILWATGDHSSGVARILEIVTPFIVEPPFGEGEDPTRGE